MKKYLVILLCVVMVTIMFVGCSSGKDTEVKTETPAADNATAEPKYKEEVVLGFGAQLTTLDVHEVSNVVHNQAFKLTHDTLVDLNFETGEILPKLAASWEWVDDKTLVLKLRDDVLFHNGESMKASDVVFTFTRAKEGTASAGKVKIIESVVALDDYTVQVNLNTPYVDLLDSFCIPAFSILSEKALADEPNNGYTVGTGAWKLNEFVINDHLSLDRFDKYWGGVMKTAKLKIKYIAESSVRVIALENGEIDLCLDPVSTDIQFIKDNEDLKLVEYYGTTCHFLAFNDTIAPWNNDLLRQAIAHALIKGDVIVAASDGYGKVATTFWGPTMFGYYDGFEDNDYDYDLEKAKELLAEAGFPNGLDMEITVTSGFRVNAAEVIQAQLKLIGINVKINEVDSAAMTSITNDAKHEAIIFGLGFNTSGDDIRRAYGDGSKTNRSHYHNDRVNELMDIAVGEIDTEKRIELYKELQEIAHEELPVIPLYYPTEFVGINKNLAGITWYQTPNNDFSGVYVTE